MRGQHLVSEAPIPGGSHGRHVPPAPSDGKKPKKRGPITFKERLSKRLPNHAGPCKVGFWEMELPVEKQEFGELRDGQEQLILETLLFAVYYPADSGAGKRSCKPKDLPRWSQPTWLPEPRRAIGRGYGKFAKMSPKLIKTYMTSTVGWTRIPAWRNAGLAKNRPMQSNPGSEKSSPDSEKDSRQFPVLVFSHGIGGHRTCYSQFCGDMASYGFIVFAVEHRDGSGARTFVNRPDGTSRKVDYLWPPGRVDDTRPKNETDHPMRRKQVEMRSAEIAHMIRTIEKIDDGQGEELVGENTFTMGKKGRKTFGLRGIDWSQWKHRMQCDRIVLGGHSFGGSTAVEMGRDPGIENIQSVILLDPWADGIARPSIVEHPVKRPMLGLMSESFLFLENNYDQLYEIFRDAVKESPQTYLMTLRGSFHLAASDFAVLYPALLRVFAKNTINQGRAIDIHVNACLEFCRRTLSSTVISEEPELLDVEVIDEGKLDRRRYPTPAKVLAQGSNEIWMHVRP